MPAVCSAILSCPIAEREPVSDEAMSVDQQCVSQYFVAADVSAVSDVEENNSRYGDSRMNSNRNREKFRTVAAHTKTIILLIQFQMLKVVLHYLQTL